MLSSGNCREIKQLRRIGNGELVQLVYSPDGKWLAGASTIGVLLYEVAAQKQVWSVEAGASLVGISFSPDGSFLIGADEEGHIYNWQLSDGKQIKRIESPNPSSEPPTTVALSPDGSLLAIPGYDDFVYVFNANDASQVQKLPTEAFLGGMIYRIAFSPDNKILAALSFDGTAKLWQVNNGKLLHSVEKPGERISPSRLLFSPDGQILLVEYSGDNFNETHLLRVSNGYWMGSKDGARGIYSPDGKTLAVLVDNGLDLYPYGGGKKITLPETDVIQGMVVFSPDGDLLAAGAEDGIHLWQVAEGKQAGVMAGEFPVYASLALSPDGLLLALGTYHRVELRNLVDGSLVRTFKASSGVDLITSVAYSPDGQILAGVTDNTIDLWQTSDAALIRTIQADNPIMDLAFSLDSQRLAGALFSNPLLVWDVFTGEVALTLGGQDQSLFPGFNSVAYSPDGQYLAASETLGSIDVWKTDGKFKGVLKGHEFLGWQITLAFSADSRYLASGAMDRQVIIWNIKNNGRLANLENIPDSVSGVAFSPDGKYLVSGAGSIFQFWRISDETSLCMIRGHRGDIEEVFFSPDGRLLISQSEDGTVRIWGVP